jgi:large subunit ribosomal protein L25
MKSLTIEAKVRDIKGSKTAAELRRNGEIPCVLYGGSEVIHFSAPKKSFKALVYTPEFNTVEFDFGGKKVTAVVKDLQFDAITDAVQHIDFLELIPGKKVILDLPVKLTGNPVGIKEGGKLMLKSRKLKVSILPEHLIEHIELECSDMELGDITRVKDLNFDNIEILTAPHIPVAAVLIPRLMKEEVVVAPVAAAVTTEAGATAPAAGAVPGAPGAPAAPGAAPAAAEPAKTAEKGEKKGK